MPHQQGVYNKSHVVPGSSEAHGENLQSAAEINHLPHIAGPQGVSTHAVNVLSKLSTRFKDSYDNFVGDDREIREDV